MGFDLTPPFPDRRERKERGGALSALSSDLESVAQDRGRGALHVSISATPSLCVIDTGIRFLPLRTPVLGVTFAPFWTRLLSPIACGEQQGDPCGIFFFFFSLVLHRLILKLETLGIQGLQSYLDDGGIVRCHF